MVKYIASRRNKKLSVIKEGFQGKGPYALEIQKSFPPTKFLCNSRGKLIYYEGEYNYEKHLRAYDRAKLWMPCIVDGKLTWKKNPLMKPFCRLFNAQPNLNLVKETPKTTQYPSYSVERECPTHAGGHDRGV